MKGFCWLRKVNSKQNFHLLIIDDREPQVKAPTRTRKTASQAKTFLSIALFQIFLTHSHINIFVPQWTEHLSERRRLFKEMPIKCFLLWRKKDSDATKRVTCWQCCWESKAFNAHICFVATWRQQRRAGHCYVIKLWYLTTLFLSSFSQAVKSQKERDWEDRWSLVVECLKEFRLKSLDS